MREQVQGSVWDKVFKISERGSSISRELFAGATTFLCVSYVLAVNPAILGAAGMDVGAVFTATAVSAIIMTLLLALYSNMPFAGLSGMGINAFFAYTIVVQMGHSFAFALTAQLIAGLAFLLIAVTPLKEYLFNAIPHTIKLAVTAGQGVSFVPTRVVRGGDASFIPTSSASAREVGGAYVVVGVYNNQNKSQRRTR